MSKKKWKNLINRQLTALGLRNNAYESTVESLAAILEQRDKTFDEFQESGGKSVIEYTNKMCIRDRERIICSFWISCGIPSGMNCAIRRT